MQYLLRIFVPLFIAFIPCVFSFSTLDPTLSIRFLVFSLFIAIFLIFSLIKVSKFQKDIFQNKVVGLSFLLLLLYVSSSIYNGFSSVSVYEVLKLFLFFVFLILMIQYVVNYGYDYILKSIVVFSIITSFFYVLQFIYVYPQQIDQIAATMGHKNLLCSIHFLSLPFLLYVCYYDRTLFRLVSCFAIIMIMVIFTIAQSRAVFLALIIFSIAFFFVYGKKIITFKKISILLVASIFLFGVLYISDSSQSNLDSIDSKIERTVNFKKSPRYHLYQSTLELIQHNFILGVGPGNWKIDIPQYGLYSGEQIEVKFSQGNFFAQRPHNDILWISAEGGVLSGIVYILIFLFLIRHCYNLIKNKEKQEALFFALILSTLIGYFIISLFDFPFERISHNILFNVLSALIIAKSIKTSSKYSITFSSIISCIFLACTLFVIYVGSIRYYGDLQIKKVKKHQQNKEWDLLVNSVEKSYNKYFFEVDNTATPLPWFSGLAYFNNNNIQHAFNAFQKAYDINPNHVHVINNLATCYHLMGDTERAIDLYNESLTILPTFQESRINLATIYYNQKRKVKALDVILQSRPFSYEIRKSINDRYDFYLKKIVYAYLEDFYLDAINEDQLLLDAFMDVFDRDPNRADKMMRNILDTRFKDNVSYYQAILLELKK